MRDPKTYRWARRNALHDLGQWWSAEDWHRKYNKKTNMPYLKRQEPYPLFYFISQRGEIHCY